ncbi:MAG: glycosyltransferase family 2 protein [Chthoniobacter sp.]|nr:glycosyltransferase family 2 protein [Chthoniobacter sp.]
MKFSVVIPVYQAALTLPAVISAWREAAPNAEAIVVIDDGSTDGSAEVAERAGVKVIRLAQNAGRGTARARGMRETDTPFVLMCDSALAPLDDFVARAALWFAEPKVGAVFACLTQSPPRTFVDRWRGRHLFKSEPSALNRQALLGTGLCVLRREAVEQVAGFDTTLRSGEDADLGRRLLAGGWDVVADPALRAINLRGESAHALLARYARWNSPQGVRGRLWLRQFAYAVKVMALQDLRAGDPLAAMLSLAAPFYQLRRR